MAAIHRSASLPPARVPSRARVRPGAPPLRQPHVMFSQLHEPCGGEAGGLPRALPRQVRTGHGQSSLALRPADGQLWESSSSKKNPHLRFTEEL